MTLASNCNDALVVLLTIADIVTNIMVMVSFYSDDRMSYFWISFSVLLTTHLIYISVVSYVGGITPWEVCVDAPCSFQDDVDELLPDSDIIKGGVCCCAIVPFAIIYNILSFSVLITFAFLVPFGWYIVSRLDSDPSKFGSFGIFNKEIAQWHAGFLLEAVVESLPQCILQLVAVIHFDDTNHLIVASVILSMTSIMIKLLVCTQGLGWKSRSFRWCALCFCTDFVGIVFVICCLFLFDQHFDGEFLGHFGIVGQVWCWKVMIAILPPFAIALVAWFLVGFWLWLADNLWSERGTVLAKLFLSFLAFTCGNAAFLVIFAVGTAVTVFCMEFACFSILALFLLHSKAITRWDDMAMPVVVIRRWIGNTSNLHHDRIVRILAVNDVLSGDVKLKKFIRTKKEEETLYDISYSDIRSNCNDPSSANIWSLTIRKALNSGPVSLVIVPFIAIFLYFLSRILTVFYPLWILIAFSQRGLWSEVDLFGVIILGMYIALQLVTIIDGIFLFRSHWYLWHIAPGHSALRSPPEVIFRKEILQKSYDALLYIPTVRELIETQFGPDVAVLIMRYLKLLQEVVVPQPANVQRDVFRVLGVFAESNLLKQYVVRSEAADLPHWKRTKFVSDFHILDLDNDGVLDEFELMITLKRWHTEIEAEQMARRIVKDIAGDEDAVITVDDWIHSNVAGSSVPYQRYFRLLDDDGDFAISAQDLNRNGFQIDQIKDIIAEFGSKNKGTVGMKEFQEATMIERAYRAECRL